MTTLLFSHPSCVEHDPGAMHPESPARLKAVLAALEAEEFAPLERIEAPLAEEAQIARVHDAGYVSQVLAAVPASGHQGLDPDTAKLLQELGYASEENQEKRKLLERLRELGYLDGEKLKEEDLRALKELGYLDEVSEEERKRLEKLGYTQEDRRKRRGR